MVPLPPQMNMTWYVDLVLRSCGFQELFTPEIPSYPQNHQVTCLHVLGPAVICSLGTVTLKLCMWLQQESGTSSEAHVCRRVWDQLGYWALPSCSSTCGTGSELEGRMGQHLPVKYSSRWASLDKMIWKRKKIHPLEHNLWEFTHTYWHKQHAPAFCCTCGRSRSWAPHAWNSRFPCFQPLWGRRSVSQPCLQHWELCCCGSALGFQVKFRGPWSLPTEMLWLR